MASEILKVSFLSYMESLVDVTYKFKKGYEVDFRQKFLRI